MQVQSFHKDTSIKMFETFPYPASAFLNLVVRVSSTILLLISSKIIASLIHEARRRQSRLHGSGKQLEIELIHIENFTTLLIPNKEKRDIYLLMDITRKRPWAVVLSS